MAIQNDMKSKLLKSLGEYRALIESDAVGTPVIDSGQDLIDMIGEHARSEALRRMVNAITPDMIAAYVAEHPLPPRNSAGFEDWLSEAAVAFGHYVRAVYGICDTAMQKEFYNNLESKLQLVLK